MWSLPLVECALNSLKKFPTIFIIFFTDRPYEARIQHVLNIARGTIGKVPIFLCIISFHIWKVLL